MKVMVFIDGSWLSLNRGLFAGEEYVDYDKLPNLLVSKVAELFRVSPPDTVDLVRSYYFTSRPENYDPRDSDVVDNILKFQDLLRAKGHEVEVYPLDYRGRRIRKHSRDPDDPFTPKEKCVDVALATRLLENAYILNAYDVAVVVIGDLDFVPVLKAVRRLGKRVMIVSIRDNCSSVYTDPFNREGIRDAPVVFLGDFGSELLSSKVLARERLSTEEAERILNSFLLKSPPLTVPEGRKFGVITKMVGERGYGFIEVLGEDEAYFFHVNFCRNDTWEKLIVGSIVVFTPFETELNARQAKEVVFVQ